MSGFTLLLRRLWWRKWLSMAVLLVSVLTIAGAALGPLYARAGAESVLQDRLVGAGYAAGLHLSATIGSRDAASYREAQAQAPRPGAIRGYDRVIGTIFTPSQLGASKVGTNTDPLTTRLIWRQGECAHLVLVAGHCPTGPGQAIASERTASGFYAWKPGAIIDIRAPTFDHLGEADSSMRIVGVYRLTNPDASYWFGRASWWLNANPPGQLDALFVAKQALSGTSTNMLTEADFDYPLSPSAIRLSDLAAESATVHHLVATHGLSAHVNASTGLFSTLAAAAHDRHLLDLATLLVTLQLVLLAWMVLFQVISDLADARSNEIAVAKLRGHSPASTIRFGLGEPVFLLVLALPLGLVVADWLAHLFAAHLMVAGTPVLLPTSAIVMALAGFTGGLIAAITASWRTLTRSVLDQWQRTSHRLRASRVLWAAQLVLAAVAVVGVLVLRAQRPRADGGSGSATTLLAPGLLVFAVAIVGVRALPPVCRWLAIHNRGSRRLGAFMAARQVGRRPVGLREATLLAVAIGLAVFAVAGESVADTNRAGRARAETGAYRVASVWVAPKVDPIAAVDRADPDGRWAMAAATWLPDGGGSVTGTVLAVDPSRLAAVGEPTPGGLSSAQLADTLQGGFAPPLTVTGTRLRLDIALTGRHGAAPILQVDLRTTRPDVTALGGSLRDGRHVYTVTVPCAHSCQLVGITWKRPPVSLLANLSGSVTLTAMAEQNAGAWTPIDLGLAKSASWAPSPALGNATDHVTVAPDGVHDRYTSTFGGYGGMNYADPTSLPAVAAPQGVGTGPTGAKTLAVQDAYGAAAHFHVAATAEVLPVVLGDGVVMNLRFLAQALPGLGVDANWQVWLGPNAPPDALARLQAAGLHVTSVTSEAARVSVLGRQAPALALRLLLVSAIAAALLAIGGTVISVSASGRQRSYEAAALRAVGVGNRSLFSAAIREQFFYLGTALVLGVPSGVAAALLAMPVIPEFSDHPPIPLHYTPRWLPTAGFPAGLCVLLLVAAFLASWGVVRRAAPARLREAE